MEAANENDDNNFSFHDGHRSRLIYGKGVWTLAREDQHPERLFVSARALCLLMEKGSIDF
jgi:hypothetical protein